jgi:hypothetical protein
MRFLVGIGLLAACRAAPPPLLSNRVVAGMSVCDRLKVAGTIHDLDEQGEPAVGATLVAGGSRRGEAVVISDEQGSFVFASLAPAHDHVTVFYNDVTFVGPLPEGRCKPIWIGIHGHTTQYETRFVLR